MHIQLNGSPHELQPNTTLADLVENLNLGEKRIAIEVNNELISRSQHPMHLLLENDRVEIVQAIGGG